MIFVQFFLIVNFLIVRLTTKLNAVLKKEVCNGLNINFIEGIAISPDFHRKVWRFKSCFFILTREHAVCIFNLCNY